MAARGVSRRRQATKGRRPRRIGRMINKLTQGIEITPSVDPPPYTSAPWWPYTLALRATGDTQLYSWFVYTELMKSLGFSEYVKGKEQLPVLLRILSVRAWALKKEAPIQLAIYDHLGTKECIAEINDFGTSIHYAKVGWKFGSIATNDALKPDSDPLKDYVFAEISAGSGVQSLVYVQLLFRTVNATKPAMFQQPEDFEVIVAGTQNMTM